MELLLREVASNVALTAELICVVCIAAGVLETVYFGLRFLIRPPTSLHVARRAVWMRFARWIILALEFALAADIVRTAIAPTWNEIGQLAAIAVIRTGLNYFLERDLEALGGPETDKA